MPLNPELFKQLIESFGPELEEHTQAITNGLLALEKNSVSEDEYKKIIETVFRSAHNIKGTSYSLGINKVGEIAHSIESIFSHIKKNAGSLTPESIDICLASVDKMRSEFDLFLRGNQQNFNNKNNNKKEEEIAIRHDKHDYDSIRVSVNKIEKLSSLLEEMQIGTMAIREHDSHLSVLLHSIQEEVNQFRMIPVGNLLCTFPRYVRDLSSDLNKNVKLILKGEEVKIDKAVLEGLKDPIIHLLRNAIDHGIELPEVRKEIGKSEQGLITIEIEDKQSFINISITDDGAGIDVKKLSEIAENNKLFTKEELDQMTESEKLELIFRPGFTTKEIITDVSGRGVGLDAVKSNVENLKGQIHISTVLGKRTEIKISVPLSIASERGLLIASGGYKFVVPTSSVECVLLAKPEDIVNVQGGQALILKNQTIPFRMLSSVLNLKATNLPPEKLLSIMVIRRGMKLLAFLVDDIEGEKEIVIKSLRKPLAKIPCISGGTLLESNQVIMVLDPSDLMTYAMKQTQINHVLLNNENEPKQVKKHILVVDDSITTRTLEKSVLESRNYQVTVAVNGKEAWDILQKQKFSLLITDVMMPVMDGFTLTKYVKTSENLRDLPVIIVTSLGSESEKKRGIDVGADAYIIKNEFESGALLSIVSQLV